MDYDILILGAGLVGSTLACMLANSNYKVALIDKQYLPEKPIGEFELRINAYNRATEQILTNIGIWDKLPLDRIFLFNKVHVGCKTGDGFIKFAAEDIGESHLGHFIENSLVRRVLIDYAEQADNISIISGVEIDKIIFKQDIVVLKSKDSDSKTSNNHEFTTKLLIGSDGINSKVRLAADIKINTTDYKQKCIVATIMFDGDHKQTAWQKFLKTGPIGLLPLAPGYCSLAWSCENGFAEKLLALDDKDFILELNKAINGYLGTITGVSARASFPLAAKHACGYVGHRTALVGDAAHVMHPLAGLGANLGIQDIKSLGDLLLASASSSTGSGARSGVIDLDSLTGLLDKYQSSRRRKNSLLLSAMTGFNRLFSNDYSVLSKFQNFGLKIADKITPAKHLMMRHAMWLEL